MTKPRFQCVGLTSTDLSTTLNFYRRLGLEIPASADSQPHVDVEVATGVWLMWDTVEAMREMDPDFEATPAGSHLAFRCDSAADVDRVHDDLVAAGHPSAQAPFDAPWGQRYAVVTDPDGVGVDLFAPLS